MRIIGQYKGADIRMTNMYMSETYEGFLALSKSAYEVCNRELVNEDIPEMIEKLWGQGRSHYVVGRDNFDYKQKFPSLRVIALFSSTKTIKNSTADGSHLFMAWFQESDVDPFARAVTNLREIAWEEKAQDFWI